MTARGIQYAEEELGVHTVYEEAVDARNKHATLLEDQVVIRSRRREIQRELTFQEMALVAKHRGLHPDTSEAAFSRHMKQVLHDDEQMAESREALHLADDDLDKLDAEIRTTQLDVQISVGRLTELGGYFFYLAALKQPNQQRQPKQQR